jgi:hypothetical protein
MVLTVGRRDQPDVVGQGMSLKLSDDPECRLFLKIGVFTSMNSLGRLVVSVRSQNFNYLTLCACVYQLMEVGVGIYWGDSVSVYSTQESNTEST